MYPDDPTRPATAVQDYHAEQPPTEVMTEAQFHHKSQRVAQALLNEVSTRDGRIKPGSDPIRVEKALSAARQVIEAIRKARATLHKAHEDQEFEKAVIIAARALPEDHQRAFMDALEGALAKAEPYH